MRFESTGRTRGSGGSLRLQVRRPVVQPTAPQVVRAVVQARDTQEVRRREDVSAGTQTADEVFFALDEAGGKADDVATQPRKIPGRREVPPARAASGPRFSIERVSRGRYQF